MVGPTKRKPRALRSLLIAREASVSAGAWPTSVQSLTIGRPSTNDHRWSTRLEPAAWSSSVARALPIADAILPRLRTIPGSASSRSVSASPNAATASGSNPANARR